MIGRVVKRGWRNWWIIDYRNDPPMGPYDRRSEAKEDLRGLRRSEKLWAALMAAKSEAALEKVRRRFGV